MANVSREQRRLTKSRILEVATQLFLKNGFQSTTTREIALTADVSESSIFTYFGSKDALLVAMVVPERPKETYSIALTTPWETIAGLIRVHFYNVPRVDKQLLREFMAVMRRTPITAENEARRSAEEFDSRFWDAVNQTILAFELEDPDVAFSVITAIYNFCFISYTTDDTMSVEQLLLRIEAQLKYSLDPHWVEGKRDMVVEERFVTI